MAADIAAFTASASATKAEPTKHAVRRAEPKTRVRRCILRNPTQTTSSLAAFQDASERHLVAEEEGRTMDGRFFGAVGGSSCAFCHDLEKAFDEFTSEKDKTWAN